MSQENIDTFQAGELEILDWKHSPKLSTLIAESISACDQLDILVGFFYFNGLEQIRKALEQNPDIKLRVLVGMGAGIDVKGLVEYAQRYEAQTDSQISEEYRRQVKEVVNSLGSENDNWSSSQIIRLYADMIRNGRLLIKQTKVENHSKLYILNQRPANSSFYIVGSSNFSRPGLSERQELNVQIRRAGLERMQELFKSLWDEAIPVTKYAKFSDSNGKPPGIKDPLADTLSDESKFAEISPYDAYILLMQRYLALYEPKNKDARVKQIVTNANFQPFNYQLDAIFQAMDILDRTRGVLIADVVGLGKSVMGSAIGACSGQPGIVLCPPHQINEWKKYLDRFNLGDWAVKSMGDLNKVKKFLETKRADTVIVDEAHRFRNLELDQYKDLHDICRVRKVVLLTATPFNNRPRDIQALLGLFPVAPMQGGDASLKDTFGEFDKKYLETVQKMKLGKVSKIDGRAELDRIGDEVNRILRGVMIRRNRLDLKNNPTYMKEIGKRLAEQKPPIPQMYELDSEQDAFFDRILTEYFGGKEPRFQGAMYKSATYLKGAEQAPKGEKQVQENLYGMMCRFLVNRFESSFAAFNNSVESVRDYAQTALDEFVRTDRYVLDRKKLETIYTDDSYEFQGTPDSAIGNHHASEPDGFHISEFQDPEKFKADIRKDIDVLSEVLEEIHRLNLIANDPKLEKLVEVIGQILNNSYPEIEKDKLTSVRKVVVFSMFADTVEHIRKGLQKRLGDEHVAFMTGKTRTEKGVDAITQHFDASKGTDRDAELPPEILVSTDVLSEGINLNRAGLIINYDIPWNPTRVIQRIGRINRISRKVFKNIYVFNFFPTGKGESVINQRTITGNKMQMIHKIIGEDSQVLDISEEPRLADMMDLVNGKALENLENREVSEYTHVLNRFNACRKTFINRYGSRKIWDSKLAELKALPDGLKTIALLDNEVDRPRLTIFENDGFNIHALSRDDLKSEEAPRNLSFLEALNLIVCNPATPALPFDQSWWRAYDSLSSYVPKMPIKGAGTRFIKANNTLNAEEWVNRLPSELEYARKQLSEACLKQKLPEATIKKILQVNSAQDLQCIVETWANEHKTPNATDLNSVILTQKPEKVTIAAIGTIGTPPGNITTNDN